MAEEGKAGWGEGTKGPETSSELKKDTKMLSSNAINWSSDFKFQGSAFSDLWSRD